MLTIVGLGSAAGDLSESAVRAVRSGARVVLRTGETAPAEGVRALGVPFETLDALRAGSRRFDALNKKLAAEVLRMAKEGDVVYCVDGSACDDLSAAHSRAESARRTGDRGLFQGGFRLCRGGGALPRPLRPLRLFARREQTLSAPRRL